MAAEPSLSDLVIRVGNRTVSPSQEDSAKIKAALGDVVEVLESLLKLSSDERTAEALKNEGNGEERGRTTVNVERIVQTTQEALVALGGQELVVEKLRTIKSDLQEQSSSMQQSFEQRAKDFTPRPVDEAAGHVLTGGMLAGILDAVSAFDQILTLLQALGRSSGASKQTFFAC